MNAVSPKHPSMGVICRFRLREGMKVEWAWHELKTIKENVLATEVGYGSTAKQEGTEPREFGKLNMYQAWFEHRGVGYGGERHLAVLWS